MLAYPRTTTPTGASLAPLGQSETAVTGASMPSLKRRREATEGKVRLTGRAKQGKVQLLTSPKVSDRFKAISISQEGEGGTSSTSPALTATTHPSSIEKEEMLKELIDDVRAGRKYREAFSAAQMFLQDKDSSVRDTAIMLFTELVEKEHAYCHAIKAVVDSLYDNNSDIRFSTIALLVALFNQKQANKEAIEVVEENLLNDDRYVSDLSKLLFNLLVLRLLGTDEEERICEERDLEKLTLTFKRLKEDIK